MADFSIEIFGLSEPKWDLARRAEIGSLDTCPFRPSYKPLLKEAQSMFGRTSRFLHCTQLGAIKVLGRKGA